MSTELATQSHAPSASGVRYERRFTKAGSDPYENVEWGRRDVSVGDFEQAGVEAPVFWGDQSVGVVAKLYFATVGGVREDSVRQIVARVVGKIVSEMKTHGYFGDPERLNGDRPEGMIAFHDELVYLLINQYGTFNSPVWFNLGVPGRAQYASACFLLSVQDKMIGEDSITDWWRKEAIIFKAGAGTGINVSTIRGSMEPLSTGGIASGPIAYMRPADAAAGTLKSGGAHRRAAKFVRLDVSHPDILDFVNCKVREDGRMRALTAAGFDLDPTTPIGEQNVAESTSFQNQNLTVGVTDEFMRKASGDDPDPAWALTARKTGKPVAFVGAPELLRDIASAAWKCADPGMQYHDTINRWHTTPSLGDIHTTNVCGEIVQNDDTACNLANLNVLKYVGDDGKFAVDDFRYHVDVLVTAMDATCSFSELPTPRIEQNTRDLRQLGLGYTNLGAALMVKGLPYDSEEGRDFAASITGLMTARAYRRSAHLARHLGAFKHYRDNRQRMTRVIEQHTEAITPYMVGHVWEGVREDFAKAIHSAHQHGYRNSQVTTVQPGGTTSFMMGADTTGIEPAFSLAVTKGLAGGGSMRMVNTSVRRALESLGYDARQVVWAIDQLESQGRLPEDVLRNDDHREVFATALGDDTIDPMGHVKMVAAVQQMLTQSISKTVNMPADCTVRDVEEVYVEAWRLGCKAISIYRDGSKATQVLTTGTKKDVQAVETSSHTPQRRRMPRVRESTTVKFEIDGHDGYLTAGAHENGELGEIFLNGIGKDGSTLRGFCDAWAVAVSIGLQYGVPLETFVRKFSHVRFPPEGSTSDPDIPTATSMPDYIVRWLASRFLDADACEEFGVMTQEVKQRATRRLDTEAEGHLTLDLTAMITEADVGQACKCGAMMQRTGSCWSCPSCFASTGCG